MVPQHNICFKIFLYFCEYSISQWTVAQCNFFNAYISKIQFEMVGQCITTMKDLNKAKQVEGSKWMHATRGS